MLTFLFLSVLHPFSFDLPWEEQMGPFSSLASILKAPNPHFPAPTLYTTHNAMIN